MDESYKHTRVFRHSSRSPPVTLARLPRATATRLKRFLFLLLLSMVCGNAVATVQCSFPSLSLPGGSWTFNGPRDAAGPIMLSPYWHRVSGTVVTCTGASAGVNFAVFVNPTGSPGPTMDFGGRTYQVYYLSTSDRIKGLGVIMEVADINATDFTPVTTSEVKTWQAKTTNSTTAAGMMIRFGYVSTSGLKAGTLQSSGGQALRTGIFFEDWGYVGYGVADVGQSSFGINIFPTCTLSMPAKVTMPAFDANNFKLPGASAGDMSFRIDLGCGASSFNSNIRYTLTDASNANNRTSTLGLSPGTATGFGLQVLDNGVPVTFGLDSSAAGNPGQRDFGIRSKDGGQISKSLTVRYVRTGGALIPGTWSAGMTITMSYQ